MSSLTRHPWAPGNSRTPRNGRPTRFNRHGPAGGLDIHRTWGTTFNLYVVLPKQIFDQGAQLREFCADITELKILYIKVVNRVLFLSTSISYSSCARWALSSFNSIFFLARFVFANPSDFVALAAFYSFTLSSCLILNITCSSFIFLSLRVSY